MRKGVRTWPLSLRVAQLWLSLAKKNEADPRAIVCTVSSTGDNTDKNFLGYVPRQVSTHLSPVLDAGLITVSATVFCSQREQLVETGKESGGLASEIAVELSLEEYGAESHGQIASVWCAASDAARDVRIGLREVLRQRFGLPSTRSEVTFSPHLKLPC